MPFGETLPLVTLFSPTEHRLFIKNNNLCHLAKRCLLDTYYPNLFQRIYYLMTLTPVPSQWTSPFKTDTSDPSFAWREFIAAFIDPITKAWWLFWQITHGLTPALQAQSYLNSRRFTPQNFRPQCTCPQTMEPPRLLTRQDEPFRKAIPSMPPYYVRPSGQTLNNHYLINGLGLAA